jgi:hypothetical protein
VAAPLGDFQFKSPSFNGSGYSSHVLTIENQENTRQVQLRKDIQAVLDAQKTAESSTNISKFLNNLESRIYAQISQNLATAMFTATGDQTGGKFVMEYMPDKVTPFTAIEWKRVGNNIELIVTKDGAQGPTITVPLGEFVIPGTIN